MDGRSDRMPVLSPSQQTQASSQSARQRAESMGQLQVLGTKADADGALQKLDRLQKARESKRRWRKGSTIGLSRAGKLSVESIKGRQADKSSDADSFTSMPDRFGEVKLAITSMPGMTSLMSRSRRSRPEDNDPPERAVSPDAEDAPTEENSSRYDALSARLRHVRRGSLSAVSAKLSTREPPVASDHKKQPNEARPASDKGDGAPEIGLTVKSDREAHDRAPVERAPITASSPDLGAVKEDRPREEEALAQHENELHALASRQQPETSSSSAEPVIVRPVPQRPRPRLMLQSPTRTGEDMEMSQSPESLLPPPNTLTSSLDERIAALGNGQDNPTSGVSPRERSPCEVDVVTAAEACQRSLSRGSPLREMGSASSIQSRSSLDSGSESGSELSSETESDEEQECFSLNLKHGSEVSARTKKRLLQRMKRERRRARQRPSKSAGPTDGEIPDESPKRAASIGRHVRTSSLSHRVASGLQYASSQSRNKRAMEKYSPHPSRPASVNPRLCSSSNTALAMSGASSPPLLAKPLTTQSPAPPAFIASSGASSRRSSMSGAESSDQIEHPQKSAADMTDEEKWLASDLGRNFLRRWGTNVSIGSTNNGASSRAPKFRKRFISLRRARQGPSDVAEEEASDPEQPLEDDAEKALDQALGRLAAEQAPEEVGLKYEYDVLCENQRGILIFGVPKFSSKTLFQWDPAPWTDARNGDSVYNIANAQLPNPSWEWVHPEWMIDMSGDVDEAGWQYSFNFGRFSLSLFSRPQQAIPRANAKGNEIANDLFAKDMKRLEEHQTKEAGRPDDGVEALKRSAKSRNPKWSSVPTQNSYVRRRRWIRLRMRKALPKVALTPKATTPRTGPSKASNDWDELLKNLSKLKAASVQDKAERIARHSGDRKDEDDNEDLSLSDFEEGSTSPSSSTDDDNDGGRNSSFFPRQTPGNMRNGNNPMEARDDGGKVQRRRRRHARDFTGTIRELKSLLPALMDRKLSRGHRTKASAERAAAKALWLLDIDARNPYLSWVYIKRRLEDDDLAFATSSLRVRERRNAQYNLRKRERQKQAGQDTDQEDNDSSIRNVSSNGWEAFDLTKDALVEINFRRVLRVLKACKLDRQKLQLWRIWLGVEQFGLSTDEGRQEELIELGVAASPRASSSHLSRGQSEMKRTEANRWKQSYVPADPLDVWDLIERRLDRLLMAFEFQASRASFLRLLLTVHATTHAMHRIRPGHLKVGHEESLSGFPAGLTPAQQAPSLGTNGAQAGDEWQLARLPRLEFWSDLIMTVRALVEAPPLHTSPPISRSGSAASPLMRSSSPLMRSNSRNADRSQDPHTISMFANRGSFSARQNVSFVMPPSRSSTPQLIGSLSNAPIPRRLSTTGQLAAAAASSSGRSSPSLGPQLLPEGRTRRDSTTVRRSPALSQPPEKPGEGVTDGELKTHPNRVTNSNSGLGLFEGDASSPQQLAFSSMRQERDSAPNSLPTEADRAFLAELLQLPMARQQDLLVRTGATILPSALAARSKEREMDHAASLRRVKDKVRPHSPKHARHDSVPSRPSWLHALEQSRSDSDLVSSTEDHAAGPVQNDLRPPQKHSNDGEEARALSSDVVQSLARAADEGVPESPPRPSHAPAFLLSP